MADRKLPGLNVQAPWARLLLGGQKTVETRSYPLPEHYRSRDLWLIETPGRAGTFRARVIGTIRFSECKWYQSAREFYADQPRHLVDRDDPHYAWSSDRPKYGWLVESVAKTSEFNAPIPRGIIYARAFDRSVEH